MRVALVIVAACAAPHPAPAPIAPIAPLPSAQPDTWAEIAVAPASKPCGNQVSNIALATRNETTFVYDLCVPATRSLALLPAANARIRVDVILSRVGIVDRRLTCSGAVRVVPAGGAVDVAFGNITVESVLGRQATPVDCIYALVQSMIEQRVSLAIAATPPPQATRFPVAPTARAAPWVPPALRTWQPIPSPVATPKPTTLGAEP